MQGNKKWQREKERPKTQWRDIRRSPILQIPWRNNKQQR